MTVLKTKSSSKVELKIGRRIVFLYAATDKDAITELRYGNIGTITDLSPLPKGHNRLISVDWQNGSSLPLIENKDSYEVLDD